MTSPFPLKGAKVRLSDLDVDVSFPDAFGLFGLNSRSAPIDTPLTQNVVLKNSKESNVSVLIAPVEDRRSAFKYNASVSHPAPFVIRAGKEETVAIRLTVLCTTRVKMELSIKTWQDVESSEFKEATRVFVLDSQPSTKLDPDELIRGEEIGRGGFCAVFQGIYRGNRVAIKDIINRDFMSFDDIKQYEKEAAAMERYRHESIAHFVGAVHILGSQAFVSEFCRYGSLEDAMKTYPERFNESTILKCLLNVSDAMKYLHNQNAIHGNLKPDNVLVCSFASNSELVAKLSNTGTARALTHAASSTGAFDYVAPETIHSSKGIDKSVDVYSFSMLMYFLFEKKRPFDDPKLADETDKVSAIISGKRPSIPSNCPSDIGKLMEQCWNGTPSRRPSFDKIFSSIQEFPMIDGKKKATQARKKASKLLSHIPELATVKSFCWTEGYGVNFEMMCLLLSANAIPVQKLSFDSSIVHGVPLRMNNGKNKTVLE